MLFEITTMQIASAAQPRRYARVALRFARQRPLGAIGAVIILVMILAALLAGWIAPFDPLVTNYTTMLQAPSSSHWFGTDSFGRDVFTRIIYGSRTALWIGFASSLMGASLGAIIGVTSAYFGGKVDLVLQRFMDLLLSLPLSFRWCRAAPSWYGAARWRFARCRLWRRRGLWVLVQRGLLSAICCR